MSEIVPYLTLLPKRTRHRICLNEEDDRSNQAMCTMTSNEQKTTRRKILDSAQRIVGQKGFSAVGINEVLSAAGVPKGSFYHYFSSKDGFGVALLDDYFERYTTDMDLLFATSNLSGRDRMTTYWHHWIKNQTGDCDGGKCLAVKLGAEVSDLSEPMRLALARGTAKIVQRLTFALDSAVADRSVQLQEPATPLASRLYFLWLGASIMAKITRSTEPFEMAMNETVRVLQS